MVLRRTPGTAIQGPLQVLGTGGDELHVMSGPPAHAVWLREVRSRAGEWRSQAVHALPLASVLQQFKEHQLLDWKQEEYNHKEECGKYLIPEQWTYIEQRLKDFFETHGQYPTARLAAKPATK